MSENRPPNGTELELEPIDSPESLVEAFDELEDWESRYSFIIELGQEFPALADELHAPEYLVHGCQSNVWIIPQVKEVDGSLRIDFQADSDSQIVKGLIAVLHILYVNKTPEQILALDVEAVFERLALRKHLTPGRSNGLSQMVKRVRQLAELSLRD
jgi:cysteine desulfuration protein SufE